MARSQPDEPGDFHGRPFALGRGGNSRLRAGEPPALPVVVLGFAALSLGALLSTGRASEPPALL